MASRDEDFRDAPTPQSIPLQDLERPPDSQDVPEGRGPRDGNDDGYVPTSPRSRPSLSSPFRAGRRYSRLAEGSPSPTERVRRPSQPYLTLSTSNLRGDEDTVSPLENRAGLQEALGFAGLIVQPEERSRPPVEPGLGSSDVFRRDVRQMSEISPYSTPARRASDQAQEPPFFGESDTIPLTDAPRGGYPGTRWGSLLRTPDRERSSFQSVRLSDQGSPVSRLGDDLWATDAEDGRSRSQLRPRSGSTAARKASLSPSSAASSLQRAGTMVRKMSQRVINLSNEPEIVEQTIRKSSYIEEGRRHESHGIPTPTEEPAAPPSFAPSPVEKAAPLAFVGRSQKHWQQQVNPLKGKSLGIFPGNSTLRRKLCNLLVHPATEPCLLALIVIQTILLAIDSASNVYDDPRSKSWGTSWIDYAMLVLFVIYTFEIVVRTIVSGFFLNPEEYSTVGRQGGIKAAALQKIRAVFDAHSEQPRKDTPSPYGVQQPSFLRSFTTVQADMDRPEHTRQQQRVRLAQRAFLRHSFNRLDFVAVVSFWMSFVLAVLGVESRKHLYVFQMLSCLRILRLLGITSGTAVILRSLKKAAPLLVHVAFLIGFFWLLFAIVGVQSFKASLRRNCVWTDPEGVRDNFTDSFQFCGGHLNNVTGAAEPFVRADGSPGARQHKGYLCPRNSMCVENLNPYQGTVSFDNILHSLELVFVVMSSNTFSDLLYYTTHSDYLAAALFFAAGIVLLSLWLMNLLVAVITSSFQVIREESKTSAFTGAESAPLKEGASASGADIRRWTSLKRLYEKSAGIWMGIIVYGLVVQAFRSAEMSRRRARFLDASETVVTALLFVEILLRFISDWRNFHRSKRNWVDLGLAVVTTVIQIPPIRRSGQVYAWFTVFQVLRIYRVVLAVSVTRDLLILVLGNVSGIVNLVVFVFLITFLAAIFAVQIFRGELPPEDSEGDTMRISFFTIYNSFLGMYQVLSSENWTAILYNVTENLNDYGTAWIGAAFLVLWFILAHFIVLNMFIAVIQENFDMTEDEKRLQQIKAFLQRKEIGNTGHGNLALSTILKLGRDRRQRDPLDYGPATMEMLLKDAVVRDFLDETEETMPPRPNKRMTTATTQTPEVRPGMLSRLWSKIRRAFAGREPNPFYTTFEFSRSHDDLDPQSMAKEVVSAAERRKRAQREYLQRHPKYNVSLYIFKPFHPLRKACQYVVGPGRGDQRVEGVQPVKALWYSFSAFIYAAIVAMVILACIATPVYQKEYFATHSFSIRNWFLFTDLGFAALFTAEAVIKVIADGFFWTPNAYFRGSWGFIDGVVLITLWIDVVTSFFNHGDVSRAVGAFKALRALRLLNISDNARNTFHSVIIVGGQKVISAAFVSLSLLIPFAIYGLNLFNGQMRLCNDDGPSVTNLTTDCVGEYASSLYDWDVVSPRTVSNPQFSFDNFGSALFILFEIVSQEGWTDVMWSAQMITGRDLQPQPFASQGNAVFFVIFNLLGAVFVLTLFVTVFMRNYTEQTGVAFLTAEQRSWLEMRKLLRQISPSKRPSNKSDQGWSSWCYRQATKKHGRWSRSITAVILLHLLLLILEFYPGVSPWERAREILFFLFTLLYIANIVVRIVGLSWMRYRKSSWDLYSILAVGGAFVTTLLQLAEVKGRVSDQLHKLFLVSIALLLIPRNDQLDQLFKTAAASLPTIGNLLATWFVLFLVYAIAFTQTLGLTKLGETQNSNLNFRTVPKALILLFRASCGEGWNAIMEDFAEMREPYCVASDNFLDSDCGSPEWARALFVSWNIISMYIFVSLFVSLIFESFSYVYQRSSTSSAVSRDEIRRFKQAWATFDSQGTGFIPKETFPRLLCELSGIFEMRIYDGEHTVGRLLEGCRTDPATVRDGERSGRTVEGVDLDKLAQRISRIPVEEIRRRRQRLNLFYEEILVSADLERGISFTTVLMTLAHYKVINENKSLRLEEFLRRRARLQRVEEQVRRNVVIGFFDMMYWTRYRRRTLAARRSASRLQTVPSFAVPEIVVAGEDGVVSGGPASDGHVSPRSTTSPSPSSSSFGNTWQQSPMASSIDPASVSGGQLRNRAESKPLSPSSAFSNMDLPFPSPERGRRSTEMEPPSPRRRGGHSSSYSYSHCYGHGHDGPRSISGSSEAGTAGEGILGRIGSVAATDRFDHRLDSQAPPLSPADSHRRGLGLGEDQAQHARPRAESTVTRQDVLEVLDSSAWGDSIRRSFSERSSMGSDEQGHDYHGRGHGHGHGR